MKSRVKNLVFANFCHLQFNLIGHHSLQAVRAVANLFIILLFIVTIYSLINLRRTEKFVKIITHILNTFYLISCLFFFIYTFSRSIPPPLPSFFVSNWNEWKLKKKTVYFQDKNPYNPYIPYNFRVTKSKIRTFWPPRNFNQIIFFAWKCFLDM